MLTQLDKNRILDLRSQGYSYEKIHQITGFSKDTIMNVCRQDENQKKQEKEHNKIEKTNDNDVIYKVRKLESDYSKVIETGKLNERKKRKLEKQREDLRAILRSEVDERIQNEKTEIIEKRDAQWKNEIEKNYVRKEIVVNLKNQIKEKDEIILNQQNVINEINRSLKVKDKKISNLEYSKDFEIQDLKNKSGKYYNKIISLDNENLKLKNYINKKLYHDIKIKQDFLDREYYNLNIRGKELLRYIENKYIILNTLILEEQERAKNVEKREKKLDKQKEEIEQLENELYKKSELFQENVKENIRKMKQMYERILQQLYFIKRIYEQQKNNEKIIIK